MLRMCRREIGNRGENERSSQGERDEGDGDDFWGSAGCEEELSSNVVVNAESETHTRTPSVNFDISNSISPNLPILLVSPKTAHSVRNELEVLVYQKPI